MTEPSPPTEESTADAPSEDVSGPAAGPSAADQQPARRLGRVPTWLKLTVFLLAAYILSIGPMFWTWHYAEYFGGNEFIRVFYTPLRLLCEFEFFEKLINEYIRWWIL
jgi:hypothetical protein